MARRRDREWNERHFWRRTQRPEGIRHLIAGFLVIEGLVAFAVGLGLMLAYWPPIKNGAMGDPVGFCGLGIVGASIAYMFFVGVGVKIYNIMRPLPEPLRQEAEDQETESDPHKSRGDGTDRKSGPGWSDDG